MRARRSIWVVRISAGQVSFPARTGIVRIIPLHLFDSMKIISAILMALWVSTCWTNAQTISSSRSASSINPGQTASSDTPWAVTKSDGNSRIWERTTYETTPDGGQIPHIHQYTELATGLNFWDSNTKQWVESKEEIEILPNGTAAATQGQHTVTLPGDRSEEHTSEL